jgi:hypothetical protein
MISVGIYAFWLIVVGCLAYYVWYRSKKTTQKSSRQRISEIVSAFDTEQGYTATMFGSATGKGYILLFMLLSGLAIYTHLYQPQFTRNILQFLAVMFVLMSAQPVFHIKKNTLTIGYQIGRFLHWPKIKDTVEIGEITSYTTHTFIFNVITLYTRDNKKHTIIMSYFSRDFKEALNIFLEHHQIPLESQ